MSPDGGSIAVGGWARPNGFGGEVAVRAWDAATGEELYRIWHRLDVNDVAFSPDGAYLVTASWDGTARIVDRSGRRDPCPSEGGSQHNAARFSPDGRLVATAASAKRSYRLMIWDWGRGEVVRPIAAMRARWTSIPAVPGSRRPV